MHPQALRRGSGRCCPSSYVVAQCIVSGLFCGKGFAVDASLISADIQKPTVGQAEKLLE